MGRGGGGGGGAKRTACQNEMNVVNLVEHLKIALIEECTRCCHPITTNRLVMKNVIIRKNPLFESVE